MNILALLDNKFEDLELVSVVALLRRANINIDICSVNNNEFITGAFNVVINTDKLFKDIDISTYDGIFLPGGPGTIDLLENDDVLKTVKTFYDLDKYIFAICAAPAILGKVGVLDSKEYNCFPGFEKYISKGIKVNKGSVVSGKIVTACGVGYSILFAFDIIEVLLGYKVRKEIEDRTQYSCYK